ncbi:MAG: class I tRNA ligase family protein, partial [Sphingomicrobium sp.]
DAIYHFTWGTFCDWYVELVKGTWDEETKAVAAWAFDQILVMLHPFMPFVTEELWAAMGAGSRDDYPLITAKWPAPEASVDADAKTSIDGLVAVIDAVRAMRAELNIPWTAALTPHVVGGDSAMLVTLGDNQSTLARMAKLDGPVATNNVPESSAQIVVGGVTLAFPLEGAIDLDAERARLKKAVEAALKERDGLAARLGNANFTERAKPEAIEKARADHDTRAAEAEKLSAALARLG